jgi:DNA-directed RNA polymerase specialized sigma24 family protein
MTSAFANQQPSQQSTTCRHPGENHACSSHLLHVIAQIMDDLPLAQKQAVFLTMCKGLAHREIAQRTRMPLRTIKTLINAGTRIRATISTPTGREARAANLKAA